MQTSILFWAFSKIWGDFKSPKFLHIAFGPIEFCFSFIHLFGQLNFNYGPIIIMYSAVNNEYILPGLKSLKVKIRLEDRYKVNDERAIKK